MRLNQYIAQATGVSRRAADRLIKDERITVNDNKPSVGFVVKETDSVSLDGSVIAPSSVLTILLNKPVGYVCSRNGQGNKTIYDLLPKKYHNLKPVGRLDKDSSGLLLLTNDGQLANQLTHPRYQKEKTYEVRLNKELSSSDTDAIYKGVMLDDGVSKMRVARVSEFKFRVSLREGRNRQIRRTFEALGYEVTKLHRVQFGSFNLKQLSSAKYKVL